MTVDYNQTVIPNAAAVSDLFFLLKETNIALAVWYASSNKALIKLLPRFLEVSKVSDLSETCSSGLPFLVLHELK